MTFFITTRPFTRNQAFSNPFARPHATPPQNNTRPCLFCAPTTSDPTYLHDAFLCGVLPRVLRWHSETHACNNSAAPVNDGALLHDLLVYLEKDCTRFNDDEDLYNDYCYFWTVDYRENIIAVINRKKPLFVHIFETYRRLVKT